MVGTTKELACVALSVNHNLGPFMRTPIVEHMNIVRLMAHLDHRLIANLRGKVVTLRRCLTFMANEHPRVGEDVLHFKLVDILIDVDIAVNLIWLD